MTPRFILVVNSKGGCGKTTVATTLASYFVKRETHVALVDLDSQRASLRWLDRRAKSYPPIHGFSGWGWRPYPEEVRWVIMDAPGQIESKDLVHLVARADTVLIPVLPSPIDISAAADFVGALLLYARIRYTHKSVGIIANRVRANTLIYKQLRKFLTTLQIPFITALRDSQNYIRASQQGIGIFEMQRSKVASDLLQWGPIVRWIQHGSQKDESQPNESPLPSRAAAASH